MGGARVLSTAWARHVAISPVQPRSTCRAGAIRQCIWIRTPTESYITITKAVPPANLACGYDALLIASSAIEAEIAQAAAVPRQAVKAPPMTTAALNFAAAVGNR